MSAYGVAEHSSHGNLVENAYAVPVLLAGFGLTLAGIAQLRRGRASWTVDVPRPYSHPAETHRRQ